MSSVSRCNANARGNAKCRASSDARVERAAEHDRARHSFGRRARRCRRQERLFPRVWRPRRGRPPCGDRIDAISIRFDHQAVHRSCDPDARERGEGFPRRSRREMDSRICKIPDNGARVARSHQRHCGFQRRALVPREGFYESRCGLRSVARVVGVAAVAVRAGYESRVRQRCVYDTGTHRREGERNEVLFVLATFSNLCT